VGAVSRRIENGDAAFACIEGCSGVVRATLDDSHAADQGPNCPICGTPMELLKRGPGRPAKSAADKRRPRVSLRLSDAEWAQVQAKAGRRPVSVWLRDLALGA